MDDTNLGKSVDIRVSFQRPQEGRDERRMGALWEDAVRDAALPVNTQYNAYREYGTKPTLLLKPGGSRSRRYAVLILGVLVLSPCALIRNF